MKGVFFWLIMFTLLSVKVSLASGFNLKSIGSVNTDGQQISHWWYTASSPTFIGEAPAGSTVTISIDEVDASVTADASNAWSYNSGSLTGGDHSVSISNNGSTISFTLTIGSENVDWDAVNSGTSETLPTVGIIMPTVLLSSTGLGLLFGAKKLAKKD
jgi:hypothetical protein